MIARIVPRAARSSRPGAAHFSIRETTLREPAVLKHEILELAKEIP